MPPEQSVNPLSLREDFMKQLFASVYSGGLRRFEGEVVECMLPARDNVSLFTRIYRKTPLQQGSVVLVRNPYQPPSHTVPEIVEGDMADWVEAGYILVEQECRGTGCSEGICIPYLQSAMMGCGFAWNGSGTVLFIRARFSYGDQAICSSFILPAGCCRG